MYALDSRKVHRVDGNVKLAEIAAGMGTWIPSSAVSGTGGGATGCLVITNWSPLMADRNDDTSIFETDEVEANRAIEQGQGVGARELAAQREPGGVVTADEDVEFENGVSVIADENDELDESLAVQGVDDAG